MSTGTAPAPSAPDETATEGPDARSAVVHRWWRTTAIVLTAMLALSLAYGIDAAMAATRWQDHAEELEDANAELSDVAEERQAELDERSAELDTREEDVSAREDDVTSAEERIAATRITEGTWTVGTDIEPGTYRTTEAVNGDCYWAIYRSGTNQDSIVQNDIVSGGHPTVTLREDQDFESNRCGTWDQQ